MPARWDMSQRTGMSPLPAWANSGQYSATGASKSSRPCFGESVGAEGGQALGGGEDVDEGVAVPLAVVVGVVPAAPEVDDGLAVEIDADGAADLAVLGEVGGEGLADCVESWVGPSADRGVGHGLSPCRRWSIGCSLATLAGRLTGSLSASTGPDSMTWKGTLDAEHSD